MSVNKSETKLEIDWKKEALKCSGLKRLKSIAEFTKFHLEGLKEAKVVGVGEELINQQEHKVDDETINHYENALAELMEWINIVAITLEDLFRVIETALINHQQQLFGEVNKKSTIEVVGAIEKIIQEATANGASRDDLKVIMEGVMERYFKGFESEKETLIIMSFYRSKDSSSLQDEVPDDTYPNTLDDLLIRGGDLNPPLVLVKDKLQLSTQPIDHNEVSQNDDDDQSTASLGIGCQNTDERECGC